VLRFQTPPWPFFPEKHIHEVPTSLEYPQEFDDGCAGGKKSAGDIFRLFSFI